MEDIKIIFFDFDGTLFDPKTRRVSEKTMQALARLREKGVKLCLATGRSPFAIPDFGGWEFDAYLTFNGALCYNEKETIFSNPVDPEDVDRLIENAAAIGRPVSLALASRLIANGYETDLADYYKVAGLELTVTEDFDQAKREDVYQVMLGCRECDHARVLEGVRNGKIAISWERAIDVIPKNGGKGSGIEKMLEYYGLTRSQAMAFGDSHNDMEMLQAVEKGVAMGNAAPQVKQVAYDVCRTVSEDGIYHYCQENGLI